MWRDPQRIRAVLSQLRLPAAQVCPAGRGRERISKRPGRREGGPGPGNLLEGRYPGCLIVAVPAGLLSAVSVLSWGCCLWVVGGAVLAIVVYHRRAPAFLLETRSGVRIGAVAGLIAAYSSVVATAIWRVFSRYVLHQGSPSISSTIRSSSNQRPWCKPTRRPRPSGTPTSNSCCHRMAGRLTR